jgi:hypothetical protein
LTSTWSNTALLKEAYTLDVESLRTELKLDFSPADDLQLSIQLPYHIRSSGILDNFIEGWHDFFSLPNGDRDELPSRGYQFSGINRDGSTFDLSRGDGFGNANIMLRYELWEDIFLRGDLALPALNNSFGHNGLSTTIALEGQQQLSQVTLSAGAALSYLEDNTLRNIKFEPLVAYTFVDARYPLFDQLNIFASLLYSSKTLQGLKDYPNHTMYLDLGIQTALSDQSSLSIGLRENPVGGNGTTDVDLLVSLDWRV